ncbi:MAG TPA: RDD family protein [Steroidobacteraceae bacterium]
MQIFRTRSAVVITLLGLSLAVTAGLPATAEAANTAATSSQANSAPDSAPDSAASPHEEDADENSITDSDRETRYGYRQRFRHNGNDLVSVGRDAELPAGTQRDSVVAVFGSATSNGTARQDVVSVFGSTTVNGQTGGSAVAVLGNVSVNADVGHDVVAVLGNVRLGPAAHVHGHVVSILGTVTQDPAAVVVQGVERILPENFATATGLQNWVGHGLMLGRPLVIGTGLLWLWGLSFAFLVFYIILALLFREATDHCITTLNDNPGKSVITAILAVLFTPLMMVLLAITLVGIPLIPILVVALFIAGVFGKTAVLGWIGGRCFGTRPGHARPHPALAVLVGGLIAMLIYLIPLLGFLMFLLLSLIGYGAVLYALLNRVRHTTSGGAAPITPAAGPQAAAAPPAAPAAPAAPASAAAPLAEPAAALPYSTLPRVGFWVRMGALFIDAVIVCAVVRLLLDWPGHQSGRICLLGLAVYGAVMWKARATTIGGIVFDLRVVRLDSRDLDWPTVCIRALGCILSVCALGLGFIWIAVDPGQQAWHDKLAGTIVVRVPKGTPLV